MMGVDSISDRTSNREVATHHEGLKVRSPPLREAVTNFPIVVHTMRRVELPRVRRWREAFVQPAFEAVDLVLSGFQVVSWAASHVFHVKYSQQGRWNNTQLEERVRDLEHEDVWVAVVVHDEDALHSPTHAKVFIVVLQPLQTRRH